MSNNLKKKQTGGEKTKSKVKIGGNEPEISWVKKPDSIKVDYRIQNKEPIILKVGDIISYTSDTDQTKRILLIIGFGWNSIDKRVLGISYKLYYKSVSQGKWLWYNDRMTQKPYRSTVESLIMKNDFKKYCLNQNTFEKLTGEDGSPFGKLNGNNKNIMPGGKKAAPKKKPATKKPVKNAAPKKKPATKKPVKKEAPKKKPAAKKPVKKVAPKKKPATKKPVKKAAPKKKPAAKKTVKK